MAEPEHPSEERHVHLSDAEDILIHHVELPQTTISHALAKPVGQPFGVASGGR